MKTYQFTQTIEEPLHRKRGAQERGFLHEKLFLKQATTVCSHMPYKYSS